jgi:hypothetical protein
MYDAGAGGDMAQQRGLIGCHRYFRHHWQGQSVFILPAHSK